jgi:hypothetical protein
MTRADLRSSQKASTTKGHGRREMRAGMLRVAG